MTVNGVSAAPRAALFFYRQNVICNPPSSGAYCGRMTKRYFVLSLSGPFQIDIQKFDIGIRSGNAVITLSEAMAFIRENQVLNRHFISLDRHEPIPARVRGFPRWRRVVYTKWKEFPGLHKLAMLIGRIHKAVVITCEVVSLVLDIIYMPVINIGSWLLLRKSTTKTSESALVRGLSSANHRPSSLIPAIWKPGFSNIISRL